MKGLEEGFMYYYNFYDSPIGELTVVSTGDRVSHLFLTVAQFEAFKEKKRLEKDPRSKILNTAIQQLHEYFHEGRTVFDLPFEINGTEFQQKIWKQLREIPLGEVCSYQDIAKKIGHEKAVRAIGQANKANKLPIFIPCHRVIGKNQRLTGYAGDKTDLKAKLLIHENKSFKALV